MQRGHETRNRRRPVRAAAMGAIALVAVLDASVTLGLAGDDAGAVRADAGSPPRLHDTGLFADVEGRRVAAGVRPFSPQYPLWTDGAAKRRWIQLPPGSAIDASKPDAWEFPRGTRLWKEFSFDGRRVETRTLERRADGTWRYAAYRWNRQGTDAELVPARGVPEGIEVRPGLRHVIPGESDCRACHEGQPTPVLGFGALQLSPDRDPHAPHAEPVPEGGVDLRSLVDEGLVRGLPRRFVDSPPRIAAATPTERAALGYLHANCGTCHNGEGPLAPVGLLLAQDFRADGARLFESLTAVSQFRITAPGAAATGDTFRVVPGRPERSAVVLRMRSRDPLSQMPPLGTAVVDERGLALVERWIRDLNRNHKEKRP